MQGVKTALIVGAGIGGLTAAIALQQAGIEVTVVERAREFREIGAGLWLWQNALATLDKLAIGDAVRAAGVRNAHGGIHTWQGKQLVKRVPSRPDYESVAILRADLQTVLLNAVNNASIQYNAACTNFVQDDHGVTLQLGDGQQLHGDVLIGADGIRSVVRSRLFGKSQSSYAGFTAWRAITTFPHERIPAGVAWGRGTRFGFMPIRNGRVNWFAGISTAAETPDVIQGSKQQVTELFSRWFDPVPAVIEATDEADIIRSDIYFGPRLTTWGRGRVTLLGDAAHAMTPSIGQGACQAIEDALALSRCLREYNNPMEALRAYEKHRIARANAVARYARFVDWLGLWKNPQLCYLRNVTISHIPNWLRDKQLDWIIEGKVR